MKDWFTKWFDSKYYHILYKNRDQNEAKKFLTNLTKLEFFKKNIKIIDIACGKGRHSLFLSNLGYDVTGIDLSKNSIKYAKKFEKENLKFDVLDMKKTYRKNSFDIALNIFTSFGYFEKEEDDIAAIKAISNNLHKEGILIIDFMNSEKIISNLVKNELKTINGITFNLKRSIKDNFICKKIQFTDNGSHFEFTEKVKALKLSDFTKLLNFANMKIIQTFGNYYLDKFDNKNSDRLIIVARKWN